MAWSFNPVPRRLLKDHRVLMLTPLQRAVLLSLYLGSDEHGRFHCHPMSLAVVLGMVGGEWTPGEVVEHLVGVGLVHRYKGADKQTYGILDQWDTDLAADHRSKRPRSCHPSPPKAVWERAGVDGRYRGGRHQPGDTAADAVRAASEPKPDTVRTASEPRPNRVRTVSEPDPPKEGRKEGKKRRKARASVSTPEDNNTDQADRRARLHAQLGQLTN